MTGTGSAFRTVVIFIDGLLLHRCKAQYSVNRRTGRDMAVAEDINDLDRLWQAIPGLLEQGDGWALRAVLESGVAGYTQDDDTPEGLLIRHNPDGTRHLVRVNIDGPDTIIRAL
jgi:hypothetical protein